MADSDPSLVDASELLSENAVYVMQARTLVIADPDRPQDKHVLLVLNDKLAEQLPGRETTVHYTMWSAETFRAWAERLLGEL